MLRDLLQNSSDVEHSLRKDVGFNLANVLMKQNRNREAEVIFTHLLTDCEDPLGVPHKVLSKGLCRALRKQGKFADAEIVARQASDIVPVHGPADIRSQSALLALGKVKLAQEEYGEAASILRQACDAISTPYHTNRLACQVLMGDALKHLECYDESISFYARALDGCIRMFGTDHEYSRRCSKKLDRVRARLARRISNDEQRELEEEYVAGHPGKSSDGCTRPESS